MDTSKVIESKWLSGTNFAPGKLYKLAISHATLETMQDQTKKIALWFDGCNKGFLLNRTNLLALHQVLGAESDNWYGALVTLGTVPIQFQGKVTNAVRILGVEKGTPPTPQGNGVFISNNPQPTITTAPAGSPAAQPAATASQPINEVIKETAVRSGDELQYFQEAVDQG